MYAIYCMYVCVCVFLLEYCIFTYCITILKGRWKGTYRQTTQICRRRTKTERAHSEVTRKERVNHCQNKQTVGKVQQILMNICCDAFVWMNTVAWWVYQINYRCSLLYFCKQWNPEIMVTALAGHLSITTMLPVPTRVYSVQVNLRKTGHRSIPCSHFLVPEVDHYKQVLL